MSKQPGYAELHAHNAFTFLESADSPEELVRAAFNLGLSGLGVLDVDGMYSAVQTANAGRLYGLPIVHGTELTLDCFELPSIGVLRPAPRPAKSTGSGRVLHKGDGLPPGSIDPGIRLPVLATSQVGYHALCSLLSTHFLNEPGRRQASLTLAEIEHVRDEWKDPGLLALTGTARGPLQRAIRTGGLKDGRAVLERLKEVFGPEGVAVEMNAAPHEPAERNQQLALLAHESRLPLVATGSVRSSDPSRGRISDVLGSIRLSKSLDQAEPHLPAWRSFLRSPDEMALLFKGYPQAVQNAADIAREYAFDLRIIDPGLPNFSATDGSSEAEYLRGLVYRGAERHYGTRASNPEAWQLIDHELEIIEKLGFPGYFLIVKDIVDFCKRRAILCQGRGSAANSAVCYALEITAVDAVKHKMLFERFLSPDRKEAPDIDLDIEAGEREAVIQYVYEKYGRENAAQVANVITYRPKSAVRDAARAFGYPEGAIRRWSKFVRRRNHDPQASGEKEDGSEMPGRVSKVAQELQRLPRHMGLHPGGMVLTRRPVSQVCPVMWAAKEGRSVLQWDKEDCADAGLVKFDLLGLGMLTALRRAYTWLEEDGVSWNGRPVDLHNIPREDPRVYDLLCAADTVGVFQVESRAQMNTLPRLKPREFYDIVIEVALIRPGPIQGRAVSPYIRRKNGKEEVRYLHSLMEPSLKKTLGVPLFQEQLMQIAVDVAGFTPGQADELRRAIGSKRSDDRMLALRPALFEGMSRNGVSDEIQQQVFDQLKAFAQFGFPESHAFSFAFLVYASAWLKVFYPEHFYAALLASQPMGFYSPASLVEDARRHGVKVLHASVMRSQVKTHPIRLEDGEAQDSGSRVSKLVYADPSRAVLIGLETVSGIGKAAERIVSAREQAQFVSLEDLASRAALTPNQLERLAAAGALEELSIGRREGVWRAGVAGQPSWRQPFIPGTEPGAAVPKLPELTEAERVVLDYQSLGLSPDKHPLALIRERLEGRGVIPLSALPDCESGQRVLIAGMVTHRQRPATAKGTTFLSLEDETGLANIVCSSGLWVRYRQTAIESSALIIRGRIEQGDGATAVVADKLEKLVVPFNSQSRDFR